MKAKEMRFPTHLSQYKRTRISSRCRSDRGSPAAQHNFLREWRLEGEARGLLKKSLWESYQEK